MKAERRHAILKRRRDRESWLRARDFAQRNDFRYYHNLFGSVFNGFRY